MNNDNILRDLFSDSKATRNLSALYVFIAVVLLYHASVFFFIMGEEIRTKSEIDQFSITFDESIYQNQDTRTIDDNDREVISFEIPNTMYSEHSGMAMLLVSISYSETSGQFADPCDTVTADISPTGAIADWQNENNVLSGVSSDCENIELSVFVYPSYNNSTQQQSGEYQAYWEEKWSDSSHGSGVFHLEVEVNVEEPATSIVPTVQDDDEEVTITWNMIFFDVSVEEI